MRLHAAKVREFLRIAVEALGRYKLRTSLSVLGVVLGVAAVIAMTSVSEGAAREALVQVQALGLDNLVAENTAAGAQSGSRGGLIAGDADRAAALVPFVRTTSPLTWRYLNVGRGGQAQATKVLGVRPAYQTILRLAVDRGRFLSAIDEKNTAQVCVLGASLARQLFGYRNPVSEYVHLGLDDYQVVGVLGEQGTDASADGQAGNTLARHDVDRAAFVPFPTLSRRTLDVAPGQPADEIWVQVSEGERVEELARLLQRVLALTHRAEDFNIVVPRELLAQRYRTQRTFSVVIGSISALALLVGGIGIMNVMLAAVTERTREIGVRRTVGATRRDVMMQFLVESLLMTLGGGAIGIVSGVAISWGISGLAGWSTHVSLLAVLLGFLVSFFVGLAFGLYPAIKAGRLEPVDAMRYD